MISHSIRIRGAREHNLKNLDIEIPRDQFVVITGLSGSGKSSLAFDTIYAEGQRKYVESLSAYARQFLEQLQKPDIDEIEGLPPTIAIEQRSASSNPRSTVATTTEIYDYLRVLFARAGTPHCWECGKRISSQSPSQICDAIMRLPAGAKVMILAPLIRGQKGEHKDIFATIHKQGFVRARVDGQVVELPTPTAGPKLKKTFTHYIDAVVDRLIIKPEIRARLADSIETACKLSQGMAIAAIANADGTWTDQMFSEKFACPDHPHAALPELEPRIFSFNSPHGACPECHGLGTTFEFDPDMLIPDESLSLSNGAIEGWRKNGKRMNIYYSRVLRQFCVDFDIEYDEPFKDIPKKVRDVLLFGSDKAKGEDDSETWFEGVLPNLKRRFESTESEWVKERLHNYMSEQPCKACKGMRLKKESLAVYLHTGDETEVTPSADRPGAGNGSSLNIHDLTSLSVEKAMGFFKSLQLTNEKRAIAEPIKREVMARLQFMLDVGLGYISLDRRTSTLSGGEAQRIRLATQVGSGLVGVCYVLDEPTIGLHQRDNDRLIHTLKRLRDLGNSVLVVEHDEDCIRHADHLIDIGPGAGEHGGYILCQGPIDELLAPGAAALYPTSLTLQYLRGDLAIVLPETRRVLDADKNSLDLKGCREHNLKNIDVRIPTGGIVCITGVSGSGKSTLINQTLLPALKRKLYGSKVRAGAHKQLLGAAKIDKVIEIDQSPIGRTPRSNPATYVGVFDEIRKVFAKTREAKIRGYAIGRFSFNVKGGRCEACQGQGTKRIEMHFLPDVFVNCDVCNGSRYNSETLDIRYRGKSIAEVLAMTVEDALTFFENFPRVQQVLKALNDVGLGYVHLGQPSTQLSGGEAQRIKLAAELGKTATGHTLYVLDEPTTGLHFADIQKLLTVLNRLADMHNTVLIIEHNLDVIKCADWIIDMGPEGGDAGGLVVAEGTPEQIVAHPTSFTGKYLAHKLTRPAHAVKLA